VEAKLFHSYIRTDRHEANSRFPQFLRTPLKITGFASFRQRSHKRFGACSHKGRITKLNKHTIGGNCHFLAHSYLPEYVRHHGTILFPVGTNFREN